MIDSADSERHRRELVAALRARGLLSDARIETAFLAVAREQFVPAALAEGGLEAVYRDDAIAIKRNPLGMPLSSSSQPTIMAKMLELLDVRPGDRVLEIGAGSGYNAALLARLVGPSGRVTSIDIDPEIARRARHALRDASARATIVVGDGRDGHPAKAPYDRIIVTAAAGEVPRAWLAQLAEGGRVELPLRIDSDLGQMQLIPVLARRGDQLRTVGLTWGGFMPLHGGDGGYTPSSGSSLSAVQTVAGAHTGLASLSGDGIGRLSRPAARRLLASLLTEPGGPRRRGLTDLSGDRPPLVLLYLRLNIPSARRLALSHGDRWGVGLVDRRGRSAAIVSLRNPWSAEGDQRRARWRLDAYGGGAAATELDEHLTRWHELERAGRTQLLITGAGDGRMLQLSFDWVERAD